MTPMVYHTGVMMRSMRTADGAAIWKASTVDRKVLAGTIVDSLYTRVEVMFSIDIFLKSKINR